MADEGYRSRVRPEPGEWVASFPTYAEAQRAVDFLAARRFTVQHVAIVARDLRFVEQVTARRGYGDAAMAGALSGAVAGALLGFILGLLTLIAPLAAGFALALWGLVIGGLIGALVGVAAHAVSRRHRAFTSVTRLDAGRYDVVAAAPVADEVRRLLHEGAARAA